MEVTDARLLLADMLNSWIQTLQWIALSLSTNIDGVDLDTSSCLLDVLLGESDEILSALLHDKPKEQKVYF